MNRQEDNFPYGRKQYQADRKQEHVKSFEKERVSGIQQSGTHLTSSSGLSPSNAPMFHKHEGHDVSQRYSRLPGSDELRLRKEESERQLHFSKRPERPGEPDRRSIEKFGQPPGWSGTGITIDPRRIIRDIEVPSSGITLAGESELQRLFNLPSGPSFPSISMMSPQWGIRSTIPADTKGPPMELPLPEYSMPSPFVRGHDIPVRSSQPMSLEDIEASLDHLRVKSDESMRSSMSHLEPKFDKPDKPDNSLASSQLPNVLSLRPLTTIPNYVAGGKPPLSKESPWSKTAAHLKMAKSETSSLQTIMAEQLHEKEESVRQVSSFCGFYCRVSHEMTLRH